MGCWNCLPFISFLDLLFSELACYWLSISVSSIPFPKISGRLIPFFMFFGPAPFPWNTISRDLSIDEIIPGDFSNPSFFCPSFVMSMFSFFDIP